jgi:exopolysaccharide biosynthesis polyprenyl glycosylphosphotransferase
MKNHVSTKVSNVLPSASPFPDNEIIYPLTTPTIPAKRTAFSLHFSERRLLLEMVDLILINFVLLLSTSYRFKSVLELGEIWDHLPWFIFLSVVWVINATLFNIYDLSKASVVFSSLKSTSSAVVLTIIVYMLIPYYTPSLPSSRLSALSFPMLAFGSLALWRILYIKLMVSSTFHRRVFIIGAGWAGHTLAEAIAHYDARLTKNSLATGYTLQGFIDDDATKLGAKIGNVRVLGNHHNLLTLVEELQPDELILAITHTETIHPDLFESILKCREAGISVTTMATVYEYLTDRIPLEHSGRALNVVMSLNYSATRHFYLATQRFIDICVGLVGCIILILVIPFIWLANRVSSPGTLFYRQARVGKGGKTFNIIKFRSMIMDAEKLSGPVWASTSDRRITPVGSFMRKVRLDEVPQFWNILKGDMSLIGPRPERPEFAQQLAQQLPFYRIRHAIKPGLTGWAQVKYRYGASVEDTLVKLQYDLYYIKHQSLTLDLRIVLKTVGVILGFKGR